MYELHRRQKGCEWMNNPENENMFLENFADLFKKKGGGIKYWAVLFTEVLRLFAVALCIFLPDMWVQTELIVHSVENHTPVSTRSHISHINQVKNQVVKSEVLSADLSDEMKSWDMDRGYNLPLTIRVFTGALLSLIVKW